MHCSYASCRIKGDAPNKPQPRIDDKAYKLGQDIIFNDTAVFLEEGIVSILERELARA